MTIDQRRGYLLFDRIQKQSPARKPGNRLRTDGGNQRTQAGVRKLAIRVQFYLSRSRVSGSLQCSIADTDLQMRLRS
jgi:hypothetical protein